MPEETCGRCRKPLRPDAHARAGARCPFCKARLTVGPPSEAETGVTVGRHASLRTPPPADWLVAPHFDAPLAPPVRRRRRTYDVRIAAAVLMLLGLLAYLSGCFRISASQGRPHAAPSTRAAHRGCTCARRSRRGGRTQSAGDPGRPGPSPTGPRRAGGRGLRPAQGPLPRQGEVAGMAVRAGPRPQLLRRLPTRLFRLPRERHPRMGRGRAERAFLSLWGCSRSRVLAGRFPGDSPSTATAPSICGV